MAPKAKSGGGAKKAPAPKAKAPAPKPKAAPKATPAKKAAAPKPRKAPAKKETSDRMSAIAARALRGEKMTPEEIQAMGGALLVQDETPGPRKPPKKKPGS